MLTCALLSMLAAADVQPAMLSAGAPRAIRLVAADPPLPSYRGWSTAQLRSEFVRLQDLRPGVALPVTMLLVGATGLAVSFFAYAIALGNFRGASTEANIAFGLGASVSAGMTAFGIIDLARGAADRRVYAAQMHAVERLADAHERDEHLLQIWEDRHGPGALPPPIIGPPPRGPPPPTSAPPIAPSAPIFPGITLMIPLLSGRF